MFKGVFPAYVYVTRLKNAEMTRREYESNRDICVGRNSYRMVGVSNTPKARYP